MFLGVFGKLWKATISFVMSVRPYGRNRLPLDGFTRNYFSKKSVEKIQVPLKSDNQNRYFT